MADAAALPRTHAWLRDEAWRLTGMKEFLAALYTRLNEEGMGIERAACFVFTIHPSYAGEAYIWRRDTAGIEIEYGQHGLTSAPEYKNSPPHFIANGKDRFRCRLDGEHPLRFPILERFRADGNTDYLIFAIPFSNRARPSIAIQSRAPDGFDEARAEALLALGPYIARIVENLVVRQIASMLVETYVGPGTGARIVAGRVRRGSYDLIEAAIFLCDLRGFTAISDHEEPEVLLETLNAYFDAMGGAIHEHGGEILKFIGDAILAIFPVGEGTDRAAASRQALAAAQAGMRDLAAVSDLRETTGNVPLRAGVGIHVGQVIYGNIGLERRLDYTTIGPAVNLTARIESRCKDLDEPILLSGALAELLADGQARSLGSHELPGIARAVELFAPA